MLPAIINLRLWKLITCNASRTVILIPRNYSKKLLFFLLLVLTGRFIHAQEYSYVHYDTKDGLAGSTVYDLCQDIYGFMWFATEAGVSRFDGTRFKNFTTADGLPETEIIKLYADSRGRVWMAPFKNTVCYYYDGKIHNQQNDSLLKKIKISSIVLDFNEDKDANLQFITGGQLITIKPDATSKTIFRFNIVDSLYGPMGSNPIRTNYSFIINDSAFVAIGNKRKFLFSLKSADQKKFKNHIPPPQKLTSIYSDPVTKKPLFINSFNGAWMLDTLHPGNYREVFLKGKPVSHVFVDNEKSLWFSTLGDGIYKLVSQEFKTFYFSNSNSAEIFSLEKQNGKLIAGSAFSIVYSFSGLKAGVLNFEQEFANSPHKFNANRLVCIAKKGADSLIFGFDSFLAIYNTKTRKKRVSFINTIKSIDVVDPHTLLVGVSAAANLVSISELKTVENIWPSRTTAVCYLNNEYYIGTVDGLYKVKKDKSYQYLGDTFQPLSYRTGYFAKSGDGSLWIATYGGGIIQMKDTRIISHITTNNGLTSNVCRTLFLDKNALWVGTDKGLNKIDITNPAFPVKRFGIEDGLPSNIINAIYIDSNNVFIGSPAGLTFFDERKVSGYSSCDLRIVDISVSNKIQPVQKFHQLGYKDNNIKISFAGISFRSGGDILYRYRLKGLTSDWDSTRQNILEYPSLPAGDYVLELMAINKFGVNSNTITIPFSIDAAFWQTLWFQLSVIALAILITWGLVAWRFRTARKREREKLALQQRMNDLEQLALRAQMNPHFIFNCLNSIQNFIINQNLETSNWYLTEFAHLIRQTLDNSDKESISISNEIQYLGRYLELEKMRFGNSFTYSIEVDPTLDKDFTHIPTMILQPYIENSIRHGIRYKKNGIGLIEIKFQQNNQDLLCIVEDNGIGRRKSNEFKSRLHVEYQSKGMTLTAERINILNRKLKNPITIEVIDLADADDVPAGTKIVIHFPGVMLTKFN